MKRRASLLAALLCVAAGGLPARNLSLNVHSGGQNIITVAPGATVDYAVTGLLSDNENEGLAMFAFDLSFDGRPLKQADAPTKQPMLNFAIPRGMNNPAGFGGTVKNGALVQVGGAQNTINNTFAPYPNGSVITGVAKNTPVVLVTGQLRAPYRNGTYHLKLSSLTANVIKKGETGVPFWRVDPVEAGKIVDLTIVVKGYREAKQKSKPM
jgi:hypothetical protein